MVADISPPKKICRILAKIIRILAQNAIFSLSVSISLFLLGGGGGKGSHYHLLEAANS